jgi:uncharacterized protein with HEPN domain
VSRQDADRLTDIVDAVEAIRGHLARGDLSDGLVYDAVRARLIEIGEAVKGVSADLLATEPAIPWSAIARMRDHLTHRYFDTDHAIVQDVVDNELGPLVEATRSLLDRAARDGM